MAAVPRVIYTFWDELPLPRVVHLCVDSMVRYNPGWGVVVLTRVDVAPLRPPPGVAALSVQALSDWVRLAVLSERGGVWLDSTCMCTASVERWVDLTSARVQGFDCPLHLACLESWAFACPVRNPLVCAWRREFEVAIATGFQAYKHSAAVRRHVLEQSVALHNTLPYLTIHAAFMVVHVPGDVCLRSSTADNGPFFYLAQAQWDSRRGIEHLATLPWSDEAPLIKFRGAERALLGQCIDSAAYLHRGLLDKGLALGAPDPAPCPLRVAWGGHGARVGAGLVCLVLALLVALLVARCRVGRAGRPR
jgi:hypothetical protein